MSTRLRNLPYAVRQFMLDIRLVVLVLAIFCLLTWVNSDKWYQPPIADTKQLTKNEKGAG